MAAATSDETMVPPRASVRDDGEGESAHGEEPRAACPRRIPRAVMIMRDAGGGGQRGGGLGDAEGQDR